MHRNGQCESELVKLTNGWTGMNRQVQQAVVKELLAVECWDVSSWASGSWESAQVWLNARNLGSGEAWRAAWAGKARAARDWHNGTMDGTVDTRLPSAQTLRLADLNAVTTRRPGIASNDVSVRYSR